MKPEQCLLRNKPLLRVRLSPSPILKYYKILQNYKLVTPKRIRTATVQMVNESPIDSLQVEMLNIYDEGVRRGTQSMI